MKYCMHCRKLAEFIIQWGPKPDQKEYVCSEHMTDALENIKAIEFFVVKVRKVD